MTADGRWRWCRSFTHYDTQQRVQRVRPLGYMLLLL